MTRTIKSAIPDVDPATTPKTYSLTDDYFQSPREARLNCGIAKGDVIWTEFNKQAVKALVLYVGGRHSDLYGWQPFFNVAFITKQGAWAKAWNRTYPGPVQRGYWRAGALPPEIATLFEEKGIERHLLLTRNARTS